jgi:flagellar protein FlaJ
MDTNRKVLVGSSIGFVILIIIAIIFQEDFVLSSNLILIAIILVTVPYGLYRFFDFRHIRQYEKEFPAFLRDIAESMRAGLSLIQSIHIAAKSDYGSLSREIKKIDNQLSWNVPLDKAMKNFSQRVEKSKIIVRSLMVMRQANKSGGKMEDAMDSLANNIEMLRDVQAEKSALLNQQVMMMYAIFFIFLGITIALVKFLTPLLQTQSTFELIKSVSPNPCQPCIDSTDTACIGCNTFFTVSTTFGFGEKTEAGSYYRSLFFVMIVVQGIFSGLIAGQIASDSVVAGLKHSMVMLLVGVPVFIFAIRAGII